MHIHPNAIKDAVKFVSNVTIAIEGHLVLDEMDMLGWRWIEDEFNSEVAPHKIIEKFLSEDYESEDEANEMLDMVYVDFTNIAYNYGYDVDNEWNLISIVAY